MKGKNKDEILEEIKILKENNLNEFKELKTEVEHLSTDEGSDHHTPKKFFKEKLPDIKQDALVGDKWGNCELSYAIENNDIKKVREIYKTTEDLSDADLLRSIAINVTYSELREYFNMSTDVALTVYSEAKYQLDLMGEDTLEVVDSYNFTI